MKSPFLWFGLTLLAIVVVTALGPAEKSLGTNVRVVYLHGAWVWTAMIYMMAAAVVGLVGLLTRRRNIHYWSRVLGRTGLVFWITYLPLSLWAMQTNWNGLFLSEPRWRVAIIFAIGGLAIQIGITLLENPAWASALNLIYAVILFYVLRTTDQVMHPGSPIFSSGSGRIQIYFLTLLVLTLLAAWQLARIWRGVESQSEVQVTPAE
ncbi:MAG: hypothetical protein JSV69_00270 [Chloroflexota bacterium]|nr:MAG: hypothetical protein JSV69_00270 [Chloroflexota bacterium]UCF27334.1 MAG: hypothetical protein JSW42_11925 [Chloroflexota bacterium]